MNLSRISAADDTTAGARPRQIRDHPEAAQSRLSGVFRSTIQQKRAARGPPFTQKQMSERLPDQLADLLAGLSVAVLSAVVGADALTLTPCSRSSAIFSALSSLASGGT